MIFLIGGNGFVGSAYARLFDRLGLDYTVITRQNAEAHRGQTCDLLINANGNSKKYMADRDPLWEFEESVTSVAKSLEWFRAERYVLLSSGDVYPDTTSAAVTREDQALNPALQSRYGLHKSLAEILVRGAHPCHLIIRMGGFVGPGLKKNAIYDLMNGLPLWLDPESELQFIHTDTAAEVVYGLIESGVEAETVNLGGRGRVGIGAIRDRLKSTSPIAENAKKVVYELDISRLEALHGCEMPESRTEVLRFLDEVAS